MVHKTYLRCKTEWQQSECLIKEWCAGNFVKQRCTYFRFYCQRNKNRTIPAKKAATIAVYLHHLFAIRIELQPTRCFKVTIDKFYFCGWCRSYISCRRGSITFKLYTSSNTPTFFAEIYLWHVSQEKLKIQANKYE